MADKRLLISVVVIFVIAVCLRLPKLELRPMHTDEAVHAAKLGELLEKSIYRYDSKDYHGPTLNYFTIIPAWVLGQKTYTRLDEFTLRIVPVFFGLILVLLPLVFFKGLSRSVILFAGLFTAVSPAFVFYSRYYIMEMLLVCFTFAFIGCIYRYLISSKLVWCVLAAVFLGLAHATKETIVIAVAAMVLAVILLTFKQAARFPKLKISHVILFFAIGFFVSAMLFSCFFTNPGAIAESYKTYLSYIQTASGNQLHIHPWYYYIDLLTWVEGFEKFTWNEDIIIALAVFGFILSFTKQLKDSNQLLVRFIALYTLIMVIIYSAIPYKTPWSMLSFYHGMILLAAIAASYFLETSKTMWSRVIVMGVILLGVGSLIIQSCLQDFKYYASPANPYVYAHTGTDVFKIVNRIEEVSQFHPDGNKVYIQVICPSSDYWPLPWYLRKYSNIVWLSAIDEKLSPSEIVVTTPAFEKGLAKYLYDSQPVGNKKLYVNLFDSRIEMRPGVEIIGFVTIELSSKFQTQDKK